jgi:cobalt-zinc-cadmium efflux system outer membrane protein
LEELEQMALAGNPSLSRASAMVGAARGNWIQVGLPPNPAIGYSGQQIGSGGRAEQHGVLIEQEIVGGGKLRLNRQIAARELERARQEFAAQRQRVVTDVRIGFYRALVAQRQMQLTTDLVRISEEGMKAAESLLRAKEATRADVLQAQLEMENAAILAQNARNRHTAAWQELASVVGNPTLSPTAIEGDPFTLAVQRNFDEALDTIISSSPEVVAAAIQIDRARAALERARAEPIPNVAVQGLINVTDNGIGGRPDAGLGVALPIPLFNRNQGAILRAQHEVAAAEGALAQLELDLQNRLAPSFERFANARNQVDRYRTTILPTASESLELIRKTYNAEETNYVGLLVAQRTYFQTNLNYLQAIETLRVAEAEIEGLLLMNSLQNR